MILAGLLALCIGLCFLIPTDQGQAQRVEILSEGKVLYTLSLSLDQELTITTDRGTNTVIIRDGKVAVTEASCPDHYCMNRGFCSGGAEIVCLPNRLVIRFLDTQNIDSFVG